MQVLQLGTVKLSFVFLFKRLFATSRSTPFGIAAWTMIAIITAWTIAFGLGFFFACRGNFAAWWDSKKLGKGYCLGLDFENGFALSDCIMDAIIVVMPIPKVSGQPCPLALTQRNVLMAYHTWYYADMAVTYEDSTKALCERRLRSWRPVSYSIFCL